MRVAVSRGVRGRNRGRGLGFQFATKRAKPYMEMHKCSHHGLRVLQALGCFIFLRAPSQATAVCSQDAARPRLTKAQAPERPAGGGAARTAGSGQRSAPRPGTAAHGPRAALITTGRGRGRSRRDGGPQRVPGRKSSPHREAPSPDTAVRAHLRTPLENPQRASRSPGAGSSVRTPRRRLTSRAHLPCRGRSERSDVCSPSSPSPSVRACV